MQSSTAAACGGNNDTMLVIDYSEAVAFFQRIPNGQNMLRSAAISSMFPFEDIISCSVDYSHITDSGRYIKIEIQHSILLRGNTEADLLLHYHRPLGSGANIDTQLNLLFWQQVRDPILAYQRNNKQTPSNANVVQRLDSVISRLDVLPPCGAGLEYQAASIRLAPALAPKSKHSRTKT